MQEKLENNIIYSPLIRVMVRKIKNFFQQSLSLTFAQNYNSFVIAEWKKGFRHKVASHAKMSTIAY